jgi:GlpG protein
MRLLCTLQDPIKAQTFSLFLVREGIENSLESSTNTDWGSVDYGTVTSRIWIYEEDFFEKAQQYFLNFEENPLDPRFSASPPSAHAQESDSREDSLLRTRQGLPPVTRALLFLCVLLFFYGALTLPNIQNLPPENIPAMPLFSPEINKELLFDYPQAYNLIDQIAHLYGPDAFNQPDTLPQEGKDLLEKFHHTPYWKGIYGQLVIHYKNPSTPWMMDAPLFEKIREGEIWRFISPIFLHSDIFHIFFNMIWLIALGRQMEQRLGKMRYITFILITGILTNIAQYFMSGPNFLGFSGVLCAMLTFIWVRQRRAPWEGYLLDKAAIGFVIFFILLIFSLQVIAFFLEAHANIQFAIGIANTAHLTGAALGLLLGYSSLFSWQKGKIL